MRRTLECDVLVIGSGVAGLSAAIAAAHGGAKVVVVEREPVLGGTSAISGGWLYLPGNAPGVQRTHDCREGITTYLKALSGRYYFAARMEAFLDTVPEMLDFFERETVVRFAYPEVAPDYHMELPGARPGGRALYAERFDARSLSDLAALLRPPLSSMRVFGVVPQIGHDLDQFLMANRSPRAFAYVMQRILRNWLQRVRYGRSVDLSNGNALVGRLLASARDLGVDVRTRIEAEQLTVSAGRVDGALLTTGNSRLLMKAHEGVVLACGGFSHDVATRAREFPHVRAEKAHYSATITSNDGAALRLASGVGARFASVMDPAAWAPVSNFRGSGSSVKLFPHLRAFGLPGLIVVNRDGKRFGNEADSYHDFGKYMIKSGKDHDELCAFLLADAKAMHHYGLGYAKPWPIPRMKYRANGYLFVGRTLTELATRAGIDLNNLVRTVEEFNRYAVVGEDPLCHRGESVYNQFRGDKRNHPNPSLGVLKRGPFYATKIVLGDLGTFSGLDVDEESRVLDDEGHPISRLYAVGAAAVSVFGGSYPGYGAMLGPGMAFGYRVGRTLATGRSERSADAESS
jgi:succinate dehydrogenase/fumarate reductase flavoprotein subunit